MFEVRYCIPEIGWKTLVKTDSLEEAEERFFESVELDIELGIKESWIQLVDTVNRTLILEYLGE